VSPARVPPPPSSGDNGNRLFDSQNNANGGYACPRPVGGPEVERAMPAADKATIAATNPPAVTTAAGTTLNLMYMEKMYYLVGSKLPIEWTAQHGCGGNPMLYCASTWPLLWAAVWFLSLPDALCWCVRG
jgi:hypothetical protein